MTGTWGTEVVDGHYAGHPGRVYEPRPRSLVALLDESVRFGDQDFLVQGETRVSFVQFRRAAVAAAQLLRDRGVEAGDRVLLLAHNSPAWVLGLWATWVAGAIPVLGNRWWSDEERQDAMGLAEPAVVVTDDVRLADRARSVTTDELGRFLSDRRPAPVFDPEGPSDEPPEDVDALILFTSGSSGRAKAVRLSHRSVLANQHNLLLRAGRLPQRQPDHRAQAVMLVTVPLFHIGGVTNLVTQVIAGGRLVFLRGRFDPTEVLEVIEREKITSWGGVPTMARRVIDHPDFERYDLASLRSFPLGGAPIPQTLLDKIQARMPNASRGLAATYGLSESGGFLTLAVGDDLRGRPGTSGTPYPIVELRILDADVDGNGEILVRSPTVMLGYLGRDEGPVDDDGWLHTGDIGRLDDGHLFVTGRVKDMVIRGGENVACPHVESVLLRHEGVAEVAVLGIPHHDLGEELVATVIPHPGVSLSQAELRGHARESLAYFEVPSRWLIRNEPLPVLANGKVDKQALRVEHLKLVG